MDLVDDMTIFAKARFSFDLFSWLMSAFSKHTFSYYFNRTFYAIFILILAAEPLKACPAKLKAHTVILYVS